MKIKRGFRFKRLVLVGVISSSALLAACGVNDKAVYTDATNMLQQGLEDNGIYDSEISTFKMSEVEDLGNNRYRVTGKVFKNGMAFHYSVELVYEGNSYEGEWNVQ